jgi:hypothetical protein
MFTKMNRWQRFGIGFGIVLVMLIAGFLIVIKAADTCGATPAEIAKPLPGDEFAPDPYVSWDNAITINAPLAQVWPWIAQMGDDRAGYYSYMFIERAVTLILMPGVDVSTYYNNADRIHPEWQNPPLGKTMIADMLKVKAYEPNSYLLSNVTDGDFVWNWGWFLEAVDANHTRLQVRMRLQVPAEVKNPLVTFFFSAGGFIMEQNMIQGITQRAEGSGEPANIETYEIILWLAALLAGLTAAGEFVFGRGEVKALGVGLAAVALLFVITYVQPAVWLRVIFDLALWVGTDWTVWRPRQAAAAHLAKQAA